MRSKTGYAESLEWGRGSFVETMEVQHHPGAHPVAYVSVGYREGDPRAELLRDTLSQAGFSAYADLHQDTPVIRVSGFEQTEELTKAFSRQGLTKGQPQRQEAALPTHDKGRAGHLTAAGFYLLGDTLGIFSGMSEANFKAGKTNDPAEKKEIWRQNSAQQGMGLSFGGGDVTFLANALAKQEEVEQAEQVLRDLKKYLVKNDIAIPKGSALTSENLTKKGGLLHGVSRFMREHFIAIKCLAEVLGGAFYFKAGTEQANARYKMVAGATIMAGWFSALVVKEKAIEPGSLEKAGLLDKLGAHMQERPLRFAGYAGMIHNAITACGSFLKMSKQEEKGNWSPMADLAMVASMLTANIAYSRSPKNLYPVEPESRFMQEVSFQAADLLARLPEEMQEQASAKVSAFLADKLGDRALAPGIEAHLRERTEAMLESPWPPASEGSWQDRTHARTTQYTETLR